MSVNTETDHANAGLSSADPKQITRFWSGVNVGRSNECWEWKRSLATTGYGQTQWRVNNKWKIVRCHRVAFVLSGGEFTSDKSWVLHSCHNRKCCNPRHLRAGNHTENMKDMNAEGRGNRQSGSNHWSVRLPEKVAKGDKSGARTHPERVLRGEARWNSKLTEDSVVEIRRLFAAGGVTKSQIAKAFGVASIQIRKVIKGKSWKHVK